MLENRSAELTEEISRSTGEPMAKALREVTASIDRLVYYAGWSDKYGQIFSSVNPVATPHFNFTVPEPAGVVAVLAPEAPALLPLVTLVAAVILSGNTAVAVTSGSYPIPGATFAEVLATSDLPAGVVNLLTGKAVELAPHIASHMDINGIVDAAETSEFGAKLRGGTALNLKRYARRSLAVKDWFSTRAEDPYWILDTVELKSAWHPIGL
jgi:acyl-CoA reductase-like NAD-dependent aldehyde dehydrogenase